MIQKELRPIVAIVQARLGSTRLPLKSLLSLRGLPIIDWVTRRLKASKLIDSILVAVPATALDAVLAEHLASEGIPAFMGSENDVLDRYAKAAKKVSAKTVIRVCADNPLIWGEAIDRLILQFSQTKCDYCYNHIPKNNLWPDGLGAEILSRELLEEINQNAKTQAQREHCLNYIWDNAERYIIHTFDPEEKWLCRPDIKLDIDKVEDYQKLALLPVTPSMNAQEIISLVSSTCTR